MSETLLESTPLIARWKAQLKLWVLASRPKTLGAAVAPVMVASALAFENGKFAFWPMLACLVGSLLLQLGTNFANDYFDFVQGADTEERLGPVRVTQAGLIAPETVRNAFILMFALVAVPGVYLSFVGGWPVFVIGLLSVISGILYTAGPYALAYLGLGDIFVLIFFGVVATVGTYYVQALELNVPIFLASLGPGLFSTAILAVNNLRDRLTDTESRKRTLAVRFGAQFARIEYLLCCLVACLMPWAIYGFTSEKHPYSLVASFTFLWCIPTLIKVFKLDADPALNPLLGQTGKFLLVYSALFSIGWVLQ